MPVILRCEQCGKDFDCGCQLLEIHTAGTKGVCPDCKPFLISEEDYK